jgi:hypothetical protein
MIAIRGIVVSPHRAILGKELQIDRYPSSRAIDATVLFKKPNGADIEITGAPMRSSISDLDLSNCCLAVSEESGVSGI